MATAQGHRVLQQLAALFVVFAGLRLAADLVEPLLLALFLAVISYPIVRGLVAWRVPRALAVVLVLILDVAVVVGAGALIADILGDFQLRLPAYEQRLRLLLDELLAWLRAHGARIDAARVASLIEPGHVVAFAGRLLQSAMNVIGQLFLVLLVAAFLLLEAAVFGDKLRQILPDADEELSRLERAAIEIQKYLGVKTLSNVLTALLVGAISALFALDFPLLWAALAFTLNFVPSLGSILASLPPIAVALVLRGPAHAVAYAATYTALNLLVGNVLEPRILGRTLGLSPLVVLLSMIFWGWMWGPVGALLSVPLTMSAKIALAHTTDLAWLDTLLGPAPSPRAAADPSVSGGP